VTHTAGLRRLARAGLAEAHLLAGLLLGLALGAGTLLPGLERGDGGFPVPEQGAGAPRAVAPARPLGNALPAGVLDLNTADARALVALPGIGPALAGRIVAERAARGPFASPDDLLRVPGLGAGRLERIRPLVGTGRRP
jgi:competence protein ComEA